MPQPRFDAVIFDLDGTLTDSAPGITAGVRYALTCLDWPVPSEQDLYRHIGPPLEWGFRELLGMDLETAARARDAFREYYRERGWAENALYPGVLELLERLREAKIPLVIATAKFEPLARRIVAHFDLAHYFVGLVGAGAADRSADKREIVAQARFELGIAGPAVVVGDRSHDFDAAATLGMESIAAQWGYGSASEWILAQYLAPSPQAVGDLLLP